MGRFEGKVVIISGAGRGQGAGEAKAFAAEGAAVVFGDVLDSEGTAIETEIRAAGGRAAFRHLDVSRPEDWEATVAQTIADYGRLDILVNNAGVVTPRVPIEDMTLAAWDRVMNVNLRGTFLGTKYAIPAMRRGGGGAIINIASIAGIGQSSFQEPAYATSKGAIRIFSKVTAAQCATDNIRCNTVFPGPIDTEMLRTFIPDPEKLAARMERIPLGRMGKVDEVIAAIFYLASEDAAFVTGCELVIDGGALVQ